MSKDRNSPVTLDGSTVCNSLVGVDALAGLLTVEEVQDESLDTEDTSRTTDQDDFVDVGLVDLGVTKDLLDRLERAAEQVLEELLETNTSEGGVKIGTLEEGVDVWVVDERVHLVRSQAVQRRRRVWALDEGSFLCLLLNSCTKWLTSRVSATGGLDFEDEDVELTRDLLSRL